MKRMHAARIAGLLAGIFASVASAATYNLTVTGHDPVQASASYAPAPKVDYRVAGGAWVAIERAMEGKDDVRATPL